MPLRARIAAALALFLAVPNVHAAEVSRKSWSELSQEVKSGWTVRLVLPDSTFVEGKGARFTEVSLVLQLTKSGNPQAHPKGELTVPRGSVKTLELRKNRVTGQVLGATIPLGAGAAIAGAGGAKGGLPFEGGGLVVTGLILAVAAIPLFFVGRASDRRWVSVTVVP